MAISPLIHGSFLQQPTVLQLCCICDPLCVNVPKAAEATNVV